MKKKKKVEKNIYIYSAASTGCSSFVKDNRRSSRSVRIIVAPSVRRPIQRIITPHEVRTLRRRVSPLRKHRNRTAPVSVDVRDISGLVTSPRYKLEMQYTRAGRAGRGNSSSMAMYG